MSGVADAAERRRALDLSASFIVQAPAGSGKTELLTQRVLRLLAAVDEPEEILAITFTRKAVAEMRQRVLSSLASAQGPEPTEDHRRETWRLARSALARDAACGWALLRNPNRLRIQTFDSLAGGLARQLPISSGLGASPGVVEQAERLYVQAARATLACIEDDDLAPDLEQLLRHVENRRDRLESLISALLARRDQWIQHALLGERGIAGITQALENAVTGHLQTLRDACPTAWLAELCRIAGGAAGQLGDNAGALSRWLEDLPPPGSDWEQLPLWTALAGLLLTKSGTPRRRWDKKAGFPAPSEKGIDDAEKQRRQQAKAAIENQAMVLAEQPALLRLWAGLDGLPYSGPSADQEAVLASLLRVLCRAAAELTLVFEAAGEVDFVELQARAQQALGTPDAPSDLALALDYRLRHLLVDEFQDTSSAQHRLLATLTAGWSPDDGRTLFLVGDPMQSIYRFREAEVGLYLAAWETGLVGLPLERLRLTVNFRSDAPVVGWVNAAFQSIFPDRIDVARGAVPYADATAFHAGDESAGVIVHALGERNDDAEARIVVSLVAEALATTDTKTIAVLARARSHLHAIASALDGAGIPYRAVDIRPLEGMPVVRDLRALTRALLHPGDRLSWLTLLHTPWIGLDLDDMLTLAENQPGILLQRLRDPVARSGLSDDGRTRVERLLSVIDDASPWRGRVPLREWVERCWLRLGGLATCGQGEADADAFFGLLEAHADARDVVDFAELDAAIDRLYAEADPVADGRVQLLTMHKSKGLEFDTVILPGLGRKTRGADTELLYWLERPLPQGGTDLLMAPIRAADQPAEPIADYLRALDRDKSRLEETRLLYVAATRAKRRLHLIGHVTASQAGKPARPSKGSLLEALWPQVEEAFANLPEPVLITEPMTTPASGSQTLAADWAPRLEDLSEATPASAQADKPVPDRVEYLWAGDTARHVGTLVHRYLEQIANSGPQHWPAERLQDVVPRLERALRQLGVSDEQLANALRKTLGALRGTLEDPTGRWLLEDHGEATSEWALTRQGDPPQHFVIDRSFVDEHGVRWIVDYKTGEHLAEDVDGFLAREQDRYRSQLEGYGDLLRVLEDRPIRLALYFPLLQRLVAWDYEPD